MPYLEIPGFTVSEFTVWTLSKKFWFHDGRTDQFNTVCLGLKIPGSTVAEFIVYHYGPYLKKSCFTVAEFTVILLWTHVINSGLMVAGFTVILLRALPKKFRYHGRSV